MIDTDRAAQPPIPTTDQILEALRSAVAEELERKRRLGHYVVLWENGRVVLSGPDAPRTTIMNVDVRQGPTMEVKTAVAMAKKAISDLFEEEGIRNLGLEEVEFDDKSGTWRVTIGFSRSWDAPPNSSLAALAGAIAANSQSRRSYKLVLIDDAQQKVLSVRSSQMEQAA